MSSSISAVSSHPLPHFAPVVEVAVDELVELGKGAWSPEARLGEGLDHVQLTFLHVAHEELAQGLLGPATAEHLHIGDPVVDLEDEKVGQAQDHWLGPPSSRRNSSSWLLPRAENLM